MKVLDIRTLFSSLLFIKRRNQFSKQLLLIIVIVLNYSLYSQERKYNFQPAIKDVIVYPDRAMLLRTDKLNLKVGKHLLIFDSASVQLDINSLRGFTNDKDLIINGISTHLDKKQNSNSKEYRDLEIKLQDLELKKDLEIKNIERINHDLKLIDEYAKFLSFSISENSKASESNSKEQSWVDAFQFLNRRKNLARTENQKSEIIVADLKKEIIKTNEALDKIKSLNDKTFRRVELNVQVLAEKNFEIGFYYVIYGASWTVSYGAHLESNGSLRLDYFGNIKQETGEDWENISLKLSTASPSRAANRVPLKSQFVYGNKFSTKQEYFQSESVAESNPEEESSGEEISVDSLTDSDPTIESQSGSVLFVIEEKANIPSLQKTHKVLIAEIHEKSVESKYRIVGSLHPSAHLAVQLQNLKNFPFLAGSIDSFRGNNFTGKSNLEYTPPGQKSIIGFGIDRSVDFDRSVKTFKENGNTLSTNLSFHTSIDLEITNRTDKVQKVSILERIPVSEVEEVIVEMMDDTSQGYILESRGILRWDTDLKPKENKKILLHYKVKTPANFPGSVYGS
ncbi:MAG: mucoidy inhibitor MuiA family protein [Leptospiraceae bacterium]|nr:mucoidy inhibitor MuiA family protein [Leptospiraceae bacterium]